MLNFIIYGNLIAMFVIFALTSTEEFNSKASKD